MPRAGFEAATRVDRIARAHPQLDALGIVSESPTEFGHLPVFLGLWAHANKQFTPGESK